MVKLRNDLRGLIMTADVIIWFAFSTLICNVKIHKQKTYTHTHSHKLYISQSIQFICFLINFYSNTIHTFSKSIPILIEIIYFKIISNI